jgi:hypothetical protein
MKAGNAWARPVLIGLLLAAPGAALAAPLTPALMFQHATPLNKILMLGLVLATLAAVVICAMKLSTGRAGGSPFLAALRAGGPLAGLLGGAYAALNTMIGISNVPITPPLKIIAPGIAEAILLIGLGLLAGAVAVIANWAVQAKGERGGLAA